MVQSNGQKDEQGELIFTTKVDAATLGNKLGSHAGVWGGARLSSGLRIGRTIVLCSLASIGYGLHIPPLQMGHCCRRCLCWDVASTLLP